MNTMATKWRRPEDVVVPTVWRHCVGKVPLADGTIPRFRIQDVPEHMDEEVVQFMATFFVKDEPLNLATNFAEDAMSVSESKEIWREVLRHRVGLVALVEGDDCQPPRIAGVNLTAISSRDDNLHFEQFQGTAIRQVLRLVFDHVNTLVDVFQLYDVDHYMTALGLSVDPIFRGQGLGLEILLARFDLARSVGISVTVTVFTAIASQILAARAGFELLDELPYKDYYDQNLQRPFMNLKTKTVKLMAKVIEKESQNESRDS